MQRKFPRAVLHFGADKTGSTAIQTVLHLTRQMLLEAGLVAYPPGQWHAQLGSHFCDYPDRYVYNVQAGRSDGDALRESDRRYGEELERWLSDAPACQSLVFSYEGFVDLDETALRRFKAFCERLADSVSVVLYVRPPLSYAVSAMSQRVKQGRLAWPPGDPPISPYKHFLEKITAVFGLESVCVKAFTPQALKNGDVVEDFIEILGVSGEPAEQVQASTVTANESLSWTAFRFGELLIGAFAERGLTYFDGEFHDKYGQNLVVIPGDRVRLTAEQIAAILDASSSHTEYLGQYFGISFHEDADKYRRPLAKDSPEQDQLLRALGSMLADSVARGRQHRPDFAAQEFGLLRAGLQGAKTVECGHLLCFDLEFSLAIAVDELEIGVHIFDEDGRWAFGTNTTLLGRPLRHVGRGTHRMGYYLLADLPEGQFTAGFAFAERGAQGHREVAWFDKLVTFQVTVPRLTPSIGYASLPVAVNYCQTSDAVLGPIENAAGNLETEAVLGDLTVGEVFNLPVWLNNTSDQTWASSFFQPIKLSYHWLDQAGSFVVWEGERTDLPVWQVLPGQVIATQMRVVAPDVPGHYRLQLVPVQEMHCWFDQRGFTPRVLSFEVVTRDAARRYVGADMRLSTSAGRREGLAIVSTAQEGFLLLGPYAQLAAGRYIARLEGDCESGATEMWMDICRDKGTRILARLELVGQVKPGEIAVLSFELAEPVSDLDVRLWVTAQVSVRVEALCIEPVGQDAVALELIGADAAKEVPMQMAGVPTRNPA